MCKKTTNYIILIIVSFGITKWHNVIGANSKPNFVILIADDIGFDDFGCYGNNVVQTPNIDRIASEGIKFTNAYLTTSSCSPSRISIITSRYPHNTGAAELHTQPSIDFPTIATELKKAGYYNAHAGKWHMGELIKGGFDLVQEGRRLNGSGGENAWVSTIQNLDLSKPFFLWLAAIDAHRPWGPNDFSGAHSYDKIKPPVTLDNDDETRMDLASYYDEVKRFDYYVGLVEEELKKIGQLDNTFIIIMSDNGRPFPRDKTRLYDSGIKTPFILKWSNVIKEKGTICSSLVSSIDIAPTLLELAGLKIPDSFQGKSFAELIYTPQKPFREYVFAEHNWHDFEAYERMVRNDKYLYIYNARPNLMNQGPRDVVNSTSFKKLLAKKESGKLTPFQEDVFKVPRPIHELYIPEEDYLQGKDLSSDKSHHEVLMKLQKILERWMDATGDTIPDNLTKDWYDRINGDKIEDHFNIRGSMPGDAQIINKVKSGF